MILRLPETAPPKKEAKRQAMSRKKVMERSEAMRGQANPKKIWDRMTQKKNVMKIQRIPPGIQLMNDSADESNMEEVTAYIKKEVVEDQERGEADSAHA
jgi:hypothetical protein